VETVVGAALGDYDGKLVLTNGSTTLHVPFWVRVVPAAAARNVLLIDDDGTEFGGFADYRATYEAMLTALGVSFDTVNPATDGFPTLGTLQGYQAVLMFTGDNNSFDTSALFEEDQNTLAEYLDSGGRLWTTGQNFAETSDSNGDFASPNLGRSRLYHGYLGLRFEDDSVYPSAVPRPTADGNGPMSGLKVDVGTGGDGAGNQTSIEASSPMPNNDSFEDPETMTTLFLQRGGDSPTGSAIAFGRSSEPSLAETRQVFRYRTVSMGFGMEAVNSSAGNVTRQQLGKRTLDWLLDTLSVSISPQSVQPGRNTTLTATASSSVGAAITQYRWDFGEGGPVITTTSPTVQHLFRSFAIVKVEVTDALGHRAVASTTSRLPGR
jgi:hypothetical protein